MKIIVVALFALIFNSAFACKFPFSGPEYDALIEISESKEKNTFYINIPRQLNNSWVKFIGIAFQKKEPIYYEGEEEPRFEYITENVETLYSHNFLDYFRLINRDIVRLVYKAKWREGYIQKITVSWPTELCWTNATSDLLVVK